MKILVNTTSWSDERQARADEAGLPVTGENRGDDAPMICVAISSEQEVAAFPKFGTYGIGFWYGKDGNTNLPWTCDTDQILDHIYDNSDAEVSREEVREAIQLLQDGLPWVANEYGAPLEYDPRLGTLRRYPDMAALVG